MGPERADEFQCIAVELGQHARRVRKGRAEYQLEANIARMHRGRTPDFRVMHGVIQRAVAAGRLSEHAATVGFPRHV